MATFAKSKDLLDNTASPMGDLIAEIGRGVASAQRAIDQQVLDSFKAIYGEDDDFAEELRSIGYQPTWYHIPEAEAEINMSLSMGGSTSSSTTTKRQLFGTTVDAATQNQFNFKSELSSKLKFKVVPIPPQLNADEIAVVPDLIGKTLQTAAALLEKLEIGLQYDGDIDNDAELLVTAQDSAAGELIDRETLLTLSTSPQE